MGFFLLMQFPISYLLVSFLFSCSVQCTFCAPQSARLVLVFAVLSFGIRFNYDYLVCSFVGLVVSLSQSMYIDEAGYRKLTK